MPHCCTNLPMALVVLAPRLEGSTACVLHHAKPCDYTAALFLHFFAAVQPLCNGLSGMMQTVLQNVATPFLKDHYALHGYVCPPASFPASGCRRDRALVVLCVTSQPCRSHTREGSQRFKEVQSHPDQAHAEPFRRKPGRARPAPLPGVQGHAQRRRLPGLHTQVSNIERFRKTGRKLRYNHAIVTMR